MTPNTNTKNLDSGLLGIDGAGSRPRSGRSGGKDGFAEVFDAQVRGTRRASTGSDQPDKPKSAQSGAKAAHDRSSGAAREAQGRTGAKETTPRQTRDTDTEADAERISAREAARATDTHADRESSEEMTSEQILAELNGNALPVEEEGLGEDLAEPRPEDAADAAAATAAEAETSADVPAVAVNGATTEGATKTADAGAKAEADLLAATNQHAATRARADAAVAAQQDAKAGERPVDDLLAAFRFSRMMSQERGSDAPRLDAAVLAEGQGPQRGAEALGMSGISGVAAASGREVSTNAAVTQTAANQAISVPLNRPGWDQAFNERVVWMARQGIQEAHIQVNPRDMGPIEVRVSVQNDQASVAFAAQNAGARDAIESALPRLREMLADSGLNLVQSEVSQQSPQERGDGRDHLGSRGGSKSLAGSSEDGAAHPIQDPGHIDSGRGMVDFFA